MTFRRYVTVFGLLVVLSLIPGTVDGREGSDPGVLFEPLLGMWEGGFVDPPVEGPIHEVKWEAILGGKAVRRIKTVSGDPLQVSLYFKDPQREEVEFLTLSSLGHVSRGVVFK